jgi:hypothetical protein
MVLNCTLNKLDATTFIPTIAALLAVPVLLLNDKKLFSVLPTMVVAPEVANIPDIPVKAVPKLLKLLMALFLTTPPAVNEFAEIPIT